MSVAAPPPVPTESAGRGGRGVGRAHSAMAPSCPKASPAREDATAARAAESILLPLNRGSTPPNRGHCRRIELPARRRAAGAGWCNCRRRTLPSEARRCWFVEELLRPGVPPEHVAVLRVEKGMGRGGRRVVAPQGQSRLFTHRLTVPGWKTDGRPRKERKL
jgi:hypothetical protein